MGTLAGLVAAVALAEWTAGHAFLVLGVIVLSMFFGFYLFRLSYAYFIFFLTIMLGQLYSILHEFSSGLLFLRLEETAIGAACGLVAALFIVPLSAHDAIRTVRYGFMEDLAAFLDVAAEIPSHPERANQLEHMVRQLENRYRQLVQVADPVTPPLAWGFSRPQVRHRLSMYAALTGYVRMVAVGLRESSADTLPECVMPHLGRAGSRGRRGVAQATQLPFPNFADTAQRETRTVVLSERQCHRSLGVPGGPSVGGDCLVVDYGEFQLPQVW